MSALEESLKAKMRSIPDYPKKGVLFWDITPLLKDGNAFRACIKGIAKPFAADKVDYVAGIEARGFIIGGAVAEALHAGFVPIRKKGKLPYKTYEESYQLEYGSNTVAIHTDAVQPGSRVLLVDDLLATGGTAWAAANLLKRLGVEILEIVFLIELSFLKGRERLKDFPVRSLIVY